MAKPTITKLPATKSEVGLSKVVSAAIVPEVLVAGAAGDIVSNLITSIRDYAIAAGQEKTERVRIGAELEKHLANVEADVDKFKAALEKNYEIKMQFYRALPTALQRAVDDGNVSMTETLTKAMLDFYDKDMANGYHKE